MTAFLKIDRCKSCRQETPWEWVPPIRLTGKPLAGTGVWRSRLINDICPPCFQEIEAERVRQRRHAAMQAALLQLLGGPKPYREFTLDRYSVTSGNELAVQKAKQFDSARQNLYLWGPSGVGKTHLAYGTARTCFERGVSVAAVRASQLTRKLRMKTPEEEQQGIDGFVRVGVLLLDDVGVGADTPYARQVLQEILDGRDFADRGGLVVTSRYSLRGLAARLNDDAIPSRLAAMCQTVEVKGPDHRSGQGKKECA
jgi:DNA replication protein DnaC